MRLRQCVLNFCVLVASVVLPAVCHAADYTISSLGTVAGFAEKTIPRAINANGQVAGDAYSGPDAASPYHAFRYSNGTIQGLPTLGGTSAGANGIDPAGNVVGYSELTGSGFTQAFWYDGVTTQSLGALVPGGISHAAGVNAVGQVVGVSTTDAVPTEKHVFVYSGGVMHDLSDLGTGSPMTAPWDINDSGQITGSYLDANNHSRGFVYTAGTLQTIDTLGGSNSFAVAMNNGGDIAGSADLASGVRHAILFDGTIHDLGSLGSGDSHAMGLNSHNDVVGWSEVVPGSMRSCTQMERWWT